MAGTPNKMVLPQAIRRAGAVCTTAKTSYGDATGAVLLCAGGANGSLLRKLTAIPRATVTATQLQLFAFDGTNYWLIRTKLMAAYAMAQTTEDAETDFGYDDTKTLYLPSGWSLCVGIGVALAAGIVFSGELGDF